MIRLTRWSICKPIGGPGAAPWQEGDNVEASAVALNDGSVNHLLCKLRSAGCKEHLSLAFQNQELASQPQRAVLVVGSASPLARSKAARAFSAGVLLSRGRFLDELPETSPVISRATD